MTEFCWLIEAPGPNYLSVRKLTTSHEFMWTKTSAEAVRFYDKSQADGMMMAIRQSEPELFMFERTLGNAWPVEHGFGERPAQEDKHE